jgi:hypothetical protein
MESLTGWTVVATLPLDEAVEEITRWLHSGGISKDTVKQAPSEEENKVDILVATELIDWRHFRKTIKEKGTGELKPLYENLQRPSITYDSKGNHMKAKRS